MEDDVHFTNNNHLKKNMDVTWFISFIFITHLEITRDAVCSYLRTFGWRLKHWLKGLKLAYYKGLYASSHADGK